MGAFDDIIKMVQQGNMFSKQMELTAQLSWAVKPFEIWKQNLSGLNMLSEIAKNSEHQAIIDRYNSTKLGTLGKAIVLQSKFNIPQSAFNAINSISQQHDLLFGNIAEFLKLNQNFSQLRSLQSALSGISGQLVAKTSLNKQWSLLDDFDNISHEAVAINERILNDEGITSENLAEIKSFLTKIEIRINKIDADASSIFWKVIAILSFILSIIGEARNWVPKPNYATKNEVESVIKNQFSTIKLKLKTQNEYRQTNRVCKVMLKPKNKTLILATLPTNFDVIVLQVNHNWIYASFVNPKDNLPQTGWILKKYLNLP